MSTRSKKSSAAKQAEEPQEEEVVVETHQDGGNSDEIVVDGRPTSLDNESEDGSTNGDDSYADEIADEIADEMERAMQSLSEDNRQRVVRRIGLGRSSGRSRSSASGLDHLHKVDKCSDVKRSVVHDYIRDKWPRSLRVLGISTPDRRRGQTWEDLHGRDVRSRLGDCLISNLPRKVQQVVLSFESGSDVCDVEQVLLDWITEGQSVQLQARQTEDTFTATVKWESVKSGTVTDCLDATVRKYFQPYIDAMYMYDSAPNSQTLKNMLSKIIPMEYKLVAMQSLKMQTDPSVRWSQYLGEVRQLMIGLEYSGQGSRHLGQLWSGPGKGRNGNAKKNGGKIICYECGKEGHKKSECPDKPAKGGWKPGPCFKCGQKGHKARDCTTGDTDDNGGGGGGGSKTSPSNIMTMFQASTSEEKDQFIAAINGLVKSKKKSKSERDVMDCSVFGVLSEPAWAQVWDDNDEDSDNESCADILDDIAPLETLVSSGDHEHRVLPDGWAYAVESSSDDDAEETEWSDSLAVSLSSVGHDDDGMEYPVPSTNHVYDWSTNPGNLSQDSEHQWSCSVGPMQDLDIYDTGAAYNTLWDRTRFRTLHRVPRGKYPPLNGFNGDSTTEIIGEGFVRFVWRTTRGTKVDVDVWCLLYEPNSIDMRINLLSAYRLSKLGFAYSLPGAVDSQPTGRLAKGRDTVELMTIGNHFALPTAVGQASFQCLVGDSNQLVSTALDSWDEMSFDMATNTLDGCVFPVVTEGFVNEVNGITHPKSQEFARKLASLGHVDPSAVVKLWKRVGGDIKPTDDAWATRHAQIAGKYRASSTKDTVSFPASLAEQSLLKSGSVICGDTLGPFPESKRGNFTLFYYQDFKHRYAWYVPGGACNSDNAWTAFKKFVQDTRLPLSFDGEKLSQECIFWCDGGSEYKRVFRERCEYFGINRKVFARYYYGRMLGESSHGTLMRLMQSNWRSGESNFVRCGFQFSDVWDHIALQSCVQMNLLQHPVDKGSTRHESMTGVVLTSDELDFLVPVPPGSWATVYNPPSARKGKGKLYGKQMLGLFMYTDIQSRVWNILVPGRGVFRTVDAKFDVNLDHIPPMICDSDSPVEGSIVVEGLRAAVRHIVPTAEWGTMDSDDSDDSNDDLDTDSDNDSDSDDDSDHRALESLLEDGIDMGTVEDSVEIPNDGTAYELNEDVVVIPSLQAMVDDYDTRNDNAPENVHEMDLCSLSVDSIFGNHTPLNVDGHDYDHLVCVTGVWRSILMTTDSKWVVAADVPVPRDYVHSQTMEYAEKWKEATDYEFNQMAKEGVYELMTLEKAQAKLRGKDPITTRLVFVVKPDTNGLILKFRVRLCVQGFKMTKGVDYFETFAAIPRMSSMRLLISVAVQGRKYKAHVDVSSAFLHSELDECDWYIIRLPVGRRVYDDNGNELYGLVVKGLYGTPPAPRAWAKKCDKVSAATGVELRKSHYDPCMQIGTTKSGKTIILLRWVDDIIVVADDKETADEFIVPFCSMLPVTVTSVELYLGAHFAECETTGQVTVTQTSLIEKGCKSVGLVLGETRPVGAPMEAGTVLRKSDCPDTEAEKKRCKQFASVYRTGVGILLWIAGMTRPDVSYAASQLSKFVSNPGEVHFKCLQRVFKYLLGTKDEGLVFVPDNKNNADLSVDLVQSNVLVAATDATYGSEEDGSFTFGIVVMLNGTPVSWRSKKWPRPSLSSFQAETIAASEGCRELEYLRGLLDELGYTQKEPTTSYCDNTGTISHTKDAKSTERSKHINVRDFYVRDCQSRGVINITKAHTSNIVADALTKAITVIGMKRMRPALLGRSVKKDLSRPP